MNVPPKKLSSDELTESTHHGLVLACMCACTILVVGLVAAINLAVPMLAASELHPGSSELLWIVDAYVIVFACLVIPAGAAGDRFGRKGILISGLVVFAIGAAISAFSANILVMLMGRTITGVGAALVLPNCVGVLVHATPRERRGKALAIWGTMSGMGGLVGNIAGAALLTTGSWQTLFAAIVPIALLLAIWAALIVKRSSRSSRSLDPVGTILLVATTVAFLIGIIEGPELGWSNAVVLSSFATSVVLGSVWVLFELRTNQPLLDPRLFRIARLSTASLGMLVMFFGSFGLFYLNASLLQYGRGYSVLQAGFAIVPMTIPMIIGTRFVPGLVKRIGIPVTLSLAFLFIGIGLFGLSYAVHLPYVIYAVWLIVIGIGFTLALPSLTAEITAALPAEQAGVAGGLQSATREFGSALGVAVVGTVLTARFIRHLPPTLKEHNPIPRTVAEAVPVAPSQINTILDAFNIGAATALQITGILTLVAGILVVTVAFWSNQRQGEQYASQSPAEKQTR